MFLSHEASLASPLLTTRVRRYLEDRANAVGQIESHIAELGTVFNKLASMVGEHAELVQRVEDNVDDAHSNTMDGLTQLAQTLTGLRSNRGLMLKIMGILAVFIVMFITFLA